jgi:hypothetical protein
MQPYKRVLYHLDVYGIEYWRIKFYEQKISIQEIYVDHYRSYTDINTKMDR